MHFKCDCFFSGRRSLFVVNSRDFGAWAGTDWGGVGAPEAQSIAGGNQRAGTSVGKCFMFECAVRVAFLLVASHH